MKIALLAPAGAMYRYNRTFHRNLYYAPVTLALLAAFVPEELGAEVVIYDETAEAIPLDIEADIIGITCITATAKRCYKYADYYRARGVTVVLGGVHPSLKPYEAMEHADSVVVGLGESNFRRMLLDYREGCIQKLYFQGENSSINDRPLPRKDLLNEKKYFTTNTVESMRGCNHSCSFCSYPAAFGSRLYKRSVIDIIGEIKEMEGRFVVFSDVNLIADKEFARELFREMIPLKKCWFGHLTADVGEDDELLKLLEKSGCKGLIINFETVNQKNETNIQEGINTVYEYAELMDKLHSKGIIVMGRFDFGSDDDETDVFKRTVKLCKDIKLDLPLFFVMTPYPGTDYYRQLEKEGRIIERAWSMYDGEHAVYRPKNMSPGELEDGMRWARKEVFSPAGILKRMDIKNLFNIIKMYSLFLALNFEQMRNVNNLEPLGRNIVTDDSDIPDCV